MSLKYWNGPGWELFLVLLHQFAIAKPEKQASLCVLNRIVVNIKPIYKRNQCYTITNGFVVSGNDFGYRNIMTSI